MPKYHLVASYYNMFASKNESKYEDEIEIDGEKLGIDLSTLQAIDAFTANYSRIEILQILEKYLNITGKNHLAIKYKKNKTEKPDFLRIIENKKEFIPCTKNNNSIVYNVLGETRRSLGVSNDADLYLKERYRFLNLLNEGKEEELKRCFPYENSTLYRLIDEYFQAPHDNEQDKETLRTAIGMEFSRYKTFRGWVIAHDNPTKKSHTKKHEIKPQSTNPPIISKTKEEYEKEYEDKFNKANEEKGITYQNHQLHQYNTIHLEQEKEEFLTEEELNHFHSYDSNKSIQNHTKKKKPLRHSRDHNEED